MLQTVQEGRKTYSQTTPQWPLKGQRKVAIVKRWPLWGGRGEI